MKRRTVIVIQLLPLALLLSRSFATDYGIIAGDALVPTNWSPSAAPIISGSNITPLVGDRLIHTFTNAPDQILNNAANIVINAGAEIITQGTPGAGVDGNNRAIRPHLFLAGTGTDGLGALKNTGGGWVQVSDVTLTANATVSLTGGGWRHDDHGTGFNALNLNGNQLTVTGNQGVWLVNTVINGGGVLNAMNTAEFNFEGSSILPANVTMNLGSGTLHSSWDGGGRVMLGNVNTANNSIIEARYNDLSKTYNGTITMAAGNTSFRTNDSGGGGGSLVINGQVTGAGQLVKDGGASVDLGTTRGIVTLNNATNNYTGGTSVTSGVLRIGAVGAIPAGSAITVSPGATLDLQGFNQSIGSGTISGNVTGAGILMKTGAGTLNIGAAVSPVGGPGASLGNTGGLDLGGGVTKTGGLGAITGPLTVSENSTLMPQYTSVNGLAQWERDGSPPVDEADFRTNDYGTAGAIFTGLTDGPVGIDTAGNHETFSWIYTGQIINTTAGNVGVSFAEQYDDNVKIKVDGAVVLNDGSWNNATTSPLVNLTPGAHTVEFSSWEGGGGEGPSAGWTKGVGIRAGLYTLTDPDGDGNGGATAGSLADEAQFLKINSANLATLGLAFGTFVSGANSDSKPINIAGGKTLTIDTSEVGGGLYTYSGNLSGAGGNLNKAGAGKLSLTGVTTATGSAIVTQGTLSLNGTHSFSSIVVASGATVDGSGSATGASMTVAFGGTIAPGNSVGTITLGTVTINGDYDAEASASGVNDLIVGNVVWGAGSEFELALSYNAAPGDSFDFINGTISGTTPTFTLPTLDPGETWNTSQFMTTGVLAVVPEPSAALLGLLGLGFLARRRR